VEINDLILLIFIAALLTVTKYQALATSMVIAKILNCSHSWELALWLEQTKRRRSPQWPV